MNNDFAIFYQRFDDAGTFNSVAYFPAITVPSEQVDSEVQRLESEGYTVTAVIELFNTINIE